MSLQYEVLRVLIEKDPQVTQGSCQDGEDRFEGFLLGRTEQLSDWKGVVGKSQKSEAHSTPPLLSAADDFLMKAMHAAA